MSSITFLAERAASNPIMASPSQNASDVNKKLRISNILPPIKQARWKIAWMMSRLIEFLGQPCAPRIGPRRRAGSDA